VFITALGVWNTMMMSVLERTAEIGVMRSMGLGRIGTVALFAIEASGIAALGGALGVAVGSAVGAWLEATGVTLGEKTVATFGSDIPLKTTLHGDISFEIAGTAFVLALVMALIGSALPSLRAASIQPVEAMRTSRR
jgi:putative ABC transport system permease protein